MSCWTLGTWWMHLSSIRVFNLFKVCFSVETNRSDWITTFYVLNYEYNFPLRLEKKKNTRQLFFVIVSNVLHSNNWVGHCSESSEIKLTFPCNWVDLFKLVKWSIKNWLALTFKQASSHHLRKVCKIEVIQTKVTFVFFKMYTSQEPKKY